MQKILNRNLFLFIGLALLALPRKAGAQPENLRDLVEVFLDILNSAVALIVALAVVVFIWGILKYITAGESEEKIREGRNYIIYGIIGIFVMVSVWGLVELLTGTFLLDNSSLPSPIIPNLGGSGSGGSSWWGDFFD